jgi:hypothetical protein
VADGDLRLRVPVGRTPTGRVVYEEADLSAEPDGRELRLSLDYAAPLTGNASRWQVSVVERLAPSYDPDRGAETLVFRQDQPRVLTCHGPASVAQHYAGLLFPGKFGMRHYAISTAGLLNALAVVASRNQIFDRVEVRRQQMPCVAA